MEHKAKISGKIIENARIADGVFSMRVEAGVIAKTACAGQFISLYSADKSRLLPRPISICEIDRKNNRLRLVYRVVGEGTKEFSKLSAGDEIWITGPLGKGFPTDEVNGRVLLFAGGIGIPPLLEAAKRIKERGIDSVSVLGYRNNDTFLTEDFKKYSEVIIASDDGSIGIKGNVIEAAEKSDIVKKYGITEIYACGPLPMLKGVKEYGMKNSLKTYISMEERMACGIGVCLGCVCESEETDVHSFVKNKRVCKDGPVFLSSEVVIR